MNILGNYVGFCLQTCFPENRFDNAVFPVRQCKVSEQFFCSAIYILLKRL